MLKGWGFYNVKAMKIGVLSDSHNNEYNLRQALKEVKKRGIKKCFHLGDYTSKDILRLMAESGLEWVGVFGNMDYGTGGMAREYKDDERIKLENKTEREVEIEKRNAFITHYPHKARRAAESGRFDACFYGHDHEKSLQKLENGTILANPGELTGGS